MEQREYVVSINGIEHTFLLTEEQVKRYPNARLKPEKSAQPKNKARAPKSKDDE